MKCLLSFFAKVRISYITGKEFNFERLDKNEADTLGVRYDYGSVMHYSKYAFTKNGNPTIMPTHPASASIGQRDGLSDLDVERITKLYGCSKYLNNAMFRKNKIHPHSS